MRCGLKSLDGVTAFPNLENLFAADNQIDTPSHLSVLNNLRFLDLSELEILKYKQTLLNPNSESIIDSLRNSYLIISFQ